MDDEMADLTQEVFDSLPDAVKEDYELNTETNLYVPIASLKLAVLKGNLDKTYEKYNTLKGEMTEAEARKAEEIEAAAEAKFKKALEDGDHAEQARILREKLEDAERREGENKEKFESRMKAIAQDQKNALIAEFAQEATARGKKAFMRILKDYITVDINGEVTYLNEDGSASTLNKSTFKATFKTNEEFKGLVKDELPSTPGLSSGSQSGGASFKKPKDMTSRERLEFKQRDPNGFRKAFNL